MIEIMNTVSAWAIPVLVVVVVAYAAWKRVPVFETFVEGGKEGFAIAVDLIPYMVAILVGLGIFRESGAFDLLAKLLNPLTSLLGIPGEVLPLAIMRPISGNGALAIAAETMQRYGPDSLLGLIACTMQGSTDTTFYIPHRLFWFRWRPQCPLLPEDRAAGGYHRFFGLSLCV